MGVGSVWACLSSIKAISLPSTKSASGLLALLILCQHCLADLCSTSYPPSRLGGMQAGMPVALLWKQTCPSVGQKPWLQGTWYK